LRNALWNGDRVTWVDFEMSRLREDKPEDFDSKANEEIEDLCELFNELPGGDSNETNWVSWLFLT
jgi:hypothetical protein